MGIPYPDGRSSADDAQGQPRGAAALHQAGDLVPIDVVGIDLVHLRYTDQGKATGLAFFGSLGDRAHAILDGFTGDELQVIARFITAMADSARQHVRELEGRLPGVRPAVPEEAAARPVIRQGGGPDDAGHAG
jgi:hypothetical protein